MLYGVIAAGIILLYVVVQLMIQYELMTKRAKISLAAALVIIVGFMVGYNQIQSQKEKAIYELVQLFLQGKNLTCKDGLKSLELNQEGFNYIGGTTSFMGKIDTPYFRKIIPVSACFFDE